MLAAVGQAHLMRTWTDLFGIYGIPIAQTLLTRGDLANRQRYLNARNTLLALLDRGVITIINENDTVAVEEIRIGDNDNLSAQVATLVDADLLVLLTDTDGLFTADPRTDPSATLIPEVAQVDARLERLTGRAGSARGTGGMATKIQAARLATQGGTAVVIANGQTPDILRASCRRAAPGHASSTPRPAARAAASAGSPVAGPAAARCRWTPAPPAPCCAAEAACFPPASPR